jgi:enterochelin esterase family protein
LLDFTLSKREVLDNKNLRFSMKSFIPFLVFIIVSQFNLNAQDTLHVPSEFSTIQAAIDSSSNGDLILVADGIYYENINFKGRAITVASNFVVDSDTNHIYNTVIDGSQNVNPDSGTVVYFVSGEDTTSVLTGFTITGGSGTLYIVPGIETDRISGGIGLDNSGAKITHNRIIGNSAVMNIPGTDVRVAAGGGIGATAVDPKNLIIEHNFIDSNFVSSISRAFGGGIAIIENTPGVYNVFICNNTITNNEVISTGVDEQAVAVSGGLLSILNKVVISGNTISNNSIDALNLCIGAGLTVAETSAEEESRIENNIIYNNTFQNAQCLGGGIHFSLAYGVSFKSNIVKNNDATFGGGLFLDVSIPLLSKNVVAGNTSTEAGGGILVDYSAILEQLHSQIKDHSKQGWSTNIFSSKNYVKIKLQRSESNFNSDNIVNDLESSGRVVEMVNNTIANNSTGVTLGGSGISAFSSTVKILNSIIWGNLPSTNPQIDGPALINYSNIEGGFDGTGNINIDPMFVDQINFYLNSSNSPCIDAGNPDSVYNDPEDPLNPGYALWPALGTIRNDMGAYGGNNTMNNSGELLGPLFRAFVERVNSVPNNEKQAIIDSFMNATTSFPFIEENHIVYYIYQGTTGSVTVPGDANGWNQNAFPMTQLNGTIFWYREAVFESDARLDYKFVINGSNWILDPLNPNQVSGGFGPNSELAMPNYEQPTEIIYYPNIPHGTIHTFPFTSSILTNTRTVKVYTPPGYDLHPNYNYPVMLFHDGLEYIHLGSADNIIDYLISENRMNPIIAVFVPPVNRDDEYAFNQTQQFEHFIVNELMPYIDSTYRTLPEPEYRAMAGLSFGGLITTQICYNNPESFGLSAPYSPSYWVKNRQVFNSVLNGLKENIVWYLDWGTYESGITTNARLFKDGLTNNGYDLVWNQWHEGHSWGSWRAHLDNALEYFFPKTVDVASEDEIPTSYSLSQNYPNPFNPSTTVEYSLPQADNVKLVIYNLIGEKMEVLVNEYQQAGNYKVTLDASNLPSGIYFYSIVAGDFIETKKMLLLK